MAGGLLTPDDELPLSAGDDVPPGLIADATLPAVATPPDASGGGSFWKNVADVGGDIGAVLGGGLDPSITGTEKNVAGTRALLNFGLTMLANSGPSYTPRNFGQILASGLQAAAGSNLLTEQTRIKAQQAAATLQLRAGQLKIQGLLAGIKAAEEAQKLGVRGAVSGAAATEAGGGGGGGGPPAGGGTPDPNILLGGGLPAGGDPLATVGQVADATGGTVPTSPAPAPAQAAAAAPAPAPSGGAAAPAPSSTPPGPATAGFGPDDFRITIPKPDFSDLDARLADIDKTYRKQEANVARSGDSQLESSTQAAHQQARAAIFKERADRLAAWQKEQTDANLADRTKRLELDAQTAREQSAQQHAVQLANIQGEQSRLTNKEQTVNEANLAGLKTAQTEQANARDVVQQLEGFRALSGAVGQPGWLQTTKLPGSDVTIAEQLGQLGLKLNDTEGVQLLRGGLNGLVKSLRQGMAMGTLSDRDLNFIQRMGPTEWMDQDTRTAAIGYLQQAYQAKMKFASDVQREMSRGLNYGDAFDAANKYQKPFVPTVPDDLTAHWTDADPVWRQRRLDWQEQNEIRPGTLFHLGNGHLVVKKGKS